MKILRATTGIALALGVSTLLAGPLAAADLVVAVRAGPVSMDPDFTATGTHAEALKHIFDTLIRSGNNLELEPGLAESWQAIDDTTWEFKLRQGVKFHDGSDFTAEDVKFSIERIPRVTGSNPTTVYVRRVQGIEIVDPYTIRLTTDGPAPTLPNDLIRLFIVSHIAAADFSDSPEHAAEGFNSGEAAIGTGPYRLVSWTPTEELVLARFDDYWGGAEPWDRVIRKEIPNDAARVAQLKAGQVDVAARIPASDVPTLERDSSLSIVKIDSVYEFLAYFDYREKTPQVYTNDGNPMEVNPFLDKRVREAIDLAIDREAITEVAMEGMGAPQSQIVTPNIFGYDPSIGITVPDIPRAKELLAEAGYPDGFRMVLNFTNDRLPSDKEVGTTIAQMLAAIGLTVEASAQPGAVYNPAATRGDYSFTMAGWGTLTGESNYTLNALLHTNDPEKKLGAFNIRYYSNPEMDRITEEAAVEMDDAKREALLQEGNRMVVNEKLILPIASTVSAWGVRNGLTLVPRSDEDTLAMNIRPAP